MCCTRLAENTGRKKSPSAHHCTTLSGYIFATKVHINNRKKSLLNSNISPSCPHNMVNFGPLAAEISSVVSGTECLAISWAGTLYIHFRGLLLHNGILPGAKFTLRPSLELSYIGTVAARHSRSDVRQTLWCWAEGATYIWQGGHDVGHWPTF